ncbi:hypothetical protein DY000_02054794 [Brassica cretica]|uniref:Ubiquinol-cytochrome C reductase hinge domain-containing protein n=1 Tax=Brassica cretica TaxID=69181 RepID=A0ABQ7AEB9_BRACR|nr:hypothetical protein DY000_02054794 [Brassica cretica]
MVLIRLSFLINFRADDEVVDPKKYLEESCNPKCVKPLLEYQACVKRIQGDDSGHKHCTGQYFDYWQCIDKCVSCTQALYKTQMKQGEAGVDIVFEFKGCIKRS